MKVFSRLATFLLFFSFFALIPTTTLAQSASITITSPNGGEVYAVGDPVHITWNTTGTAGCSISYINESTGPFTGYYIGNVASASAGSFDWNAQIPNGSIGDQHQKIQIACAGMPVDYSDNYFTVTNTMSPVCDLPAQVSLENPSTVSLHPGESTTSAIVITNPNPSNCGGSMYGISRGYAPDFTLEMPYYGAYLNGGDSQTIPYTLTASASANYGLYDYTFYITDAQGTAQTTGYVSVNPICNLTVSATLGNTTIPRINAGDSSANQLVLTNPNPAACGTNTYLISKSYPLGWAMSIPTAVSVPGGSSQSVPFTITSTASATLGNYDYSFWIYNSWADGSGTAQVNGSVTIADLIHPTVTITNPANNALVARNKTITIRAVASDNKAVSKVEFYVNGVLKCSDTTAAYTCGFLTANAKGVVYSLMAKAYDTSGNSTTATIQVKTK